MNRFTKPFVLFLSLTLAAPSFVFAGGPKDGQPPPWMYNPGPQRGTEMGDKIIKIYATLPQYMRMSSALMEQQKFRYIFGMMLARTRFEKNSMKVFFIGQDATHIAEAAKFPGTSGFGARLQSIARWLGVNLGAGSSNEFASTIKGQYGAFDHPVVAIGAGGKPEVIHMPYVDNELWNLANGRKSSVLLKREEFWEWLIKNNPDSLSLMVLFGGASRDGFGEFLKARGFDVKTRVDPERLKALQVPETKLVNAGGNNEFAVPIDKNGNDVYDILLKKNNPDYQKFLRKGRLDYSNPKVQQAAIKALEDAGQEGVDLLVFTGGGINGSGVMNAAQLGGYDLNQVYYKGERVNSLYGLRLSDGTVIERDIAFVQSAHPSALSRLTPDQASDALEKSFAPLRKLQKEKNWKIEPDIDYDGKALDSGFLEGKRYEYGRADIDPAYFEFGAPKDRRVSKADAVRLDPQSILAGSRDKDALPDPDQLKKVKASKPADPKNPNDVWSNHPSQPDSMAIFDDGPGVENAKLMWNNLDEDALFAPKPGMQVFDKNGNDITFETHGIKAYYTKTSPSTGAFGFHRGNFDTSKVLILADPSGIDEWNTSRAMTGERGQYLNGLMRDLGYGDQYLTLRTVPVGMDGATADEWEYVRKVTEKYRDAVIQRALQNPNIEMIFTDGEIAKAEMQRVLDKLGVKGKTVVNIRRDEKNLAAGIVEAGKEAQSKLSKLAGKKVTGRMADIPTSHFAWNARAWEGAGGDHVLDVVGKSSGSVHVLVTPDWVADQPVKATAETEASIKAITDDMDIAGVRIDGREKVDGFLKRKNFSGNFAEMEAHRLRQFGFTKADQMKVVKLFCTKNMKKAGAEGKAELGVMGE
ncbi:MAG: hypothetical protein JST04_17775 [Bdellovibrionales bacterium]|nr:hypothetical protein [Bdellovibrionales bacterium]